MRIAVHRNGQLTWSTPARADEDTLREPSRLLLVQALAALRQGGVKIGWPPGVDADSLAFDLRYRWPDVDPQGMMQPLLVRVAAIPMFSMAMPRSTPVVVRRPPQITYPAGSQSASVEGTVVLQFIVDSTGRVATKTIEDRWPADRPRPSGQLAEHYRAFLNAVRWGLSAARYQPATLGGCAVPQLVEQPFSFGLMR